jgi:hypothetical protein
VSRRLLKILWVDAASPAECRWRRADEVTEWSEGVAIIETVGYLVHEDDQAVTLSSQVSGYDVLFDHLQRIPRGVIVERHRLADPVGAKAKRLLRRE